MLGIMKIIIIIIIIIITLLFDVHVYQEDVV